MNRKFSVLMSIYIKEKPEYVRECFESLLNQTVRADEWVIVEDGPLSEEMYKVLDEYQTKYPTLIKRVPLVKNMGLGLALREGILHCSNDLIARMDTDDIARRDRFEKQLREFENNDRLDICGSHIIEFEKGIENVLSERKVPIHHEDIMKYQKQRSAFNHMTVMYRKSAVLKAGNYEHAPLMEDDVLWVNMLRTGAKSKNVDECLVYARTGRAMIERRGGWSYYKKYVDGRRKILDTGYITKWDYYKTVVVQFIVALVPKKVRFYLFTMFLRK